MTKERRYQLRNVARGRCSLCPRPLLTSTRCALHAARQDEYDRRYDATKRVRSRPVPTP